MKSLILLLVVSGSAAAADFSFTKTVNVDRLESELRAASFDVVWTMCSGDKCVLHLGPAESKDPSSVIAAHVYQDPAVTSNLARTQAIALAKKLKNNPSGTSAAERDALLLRLCFLLLSKDQ